VRDTRPRLTPSARAREALERRMASFGLAPSAGFVLANVGARPHSAKGYPPELWSRALAELASRASVPVVLGAGPGEEEALEAVAASSRGVHVCRAPLADLVELVALCGAARLVLTADAGPRHVAVATRTPLVVVAGPTDPRHTADHTEHTTLLRIPVDCGPCHRELCPLSGAAHHACMRRIEPDRIAAAALERLRRQSKASSSARGRHEPPADAIAS
jgi:heptosyltransferase-2